MWLVRSILVFAGIVAVLAFAISNVDQKVNLVVVSTVYQNIPLNLVLLGACLLGAALCFVVMIFREFSLRTAIRRLRRENVRLDDELVALRNLPLSGLPSSQEKPSTPPSDR